MYESIFLLYQNNHLPSFAIPKEIPYYASVYYWNILLQEPLNYSQAVLRLSPQERNSIFLDLFPYALDTLI